ncbi:MAG: flagellar motor stator protein MotA [Acidobacteriia bacterium]|nr:flagellar motor stator protein MotA [Terriglobia bacterium]
MFAIIGILVVIGAIVGGYLMEHGNLMVLLQPAELIIIGGAAVGTVLIGNPLSTIVLLLKGLAGIFKPSAFSKDFYLEHIKLLYEIFQSSRKYGMVKLEQDIEEPEKSPLFTKYPKFAKNHHALHFVCDTLRMYVSGGVSAMELDQMMELDMEVHHAGVRAPVNALSTVADALPGLGIVAAVLGVVITMGSIGGPPEEVGHKVAAALVGTFLGILLCYGFLGPMASSMAKINETESQFYHFLRVGLAAFIRGAAPILAVEFARRAIPSAVRPTFKEMEDTCKKSGKESPPAEKSAA